jgi:plastocyanin
MPIVRSPGPDHRAGRVIGAPGIPRIPLTMRSHPISSGAAPLAALAAVALLAAGCGSSSSSSSAGHTTSASATASSATTTASASSAASASPAGPAKHAVTVAIKNYAYSPATVTVAPGARVTWVNHDATTHTATDGGAFDTGNINPGQSRSVTLSKPGTYQYMCSFHPFMHGTIIVK